MSSWLGWWRTHRACLLDGALSLEHPELGYTQATARTAGERITALYSAEPARLDADAPALMVAALVLHYRRGRRG